MSPWRWATNAGGSPRQPHWCGGACTPHPAEPEDCEGHRHDIGDSLAPRSDPLFTHDGCRPMRPAATPKAL
eukprot:1267737-Lingulodinium_polyedra.AAC.1